MYYLEDYKKYKGTTLTDEQMEESNRRWYEFYKNYIMKSEMFIICSQLNNVKYHNSNII